MNIEIIFSKKAAKEFRKLDINIQKRIDLAINNKLKIEPKKHLIALSGSLRFFYKFRVGDYRLICKREGTELVILVVTVKHRKEVYNKH